jgi:nucleoid-associated protein YgaU
MGLIDFIKDVGHKLNIGGHDDPKATPQAQPSPQGAQGPSQQDLQALENRKKTTAITNLVQQMGLKAESLNVLVDGDKATLTGKVDSQEQREKIVLLAGNTVGIAKVDDQLQVLRQEPEAQYYDVKSGDTLSKIAKQFFGDANQYNRILEANRPMLKDADHIYPGQKLRIPALATAGARA